MHPNSDKRKADESSERRGIAAIGVGYRVATQSATGDEEGDADALQKKRLKKYLSYYSLTSKKRTCCCCCCFSMMTAEKGRMR